MFFLYEQVAKSEITFIYQFRGFWFVAAFIIYFSGNLFLFVVANQLPSHLVQNSWQINLILTIILNAILSVAFTFPANNKLKAWETELS